MHTKIGTPEGFQTPETVPRVVQLKCVQPHLPIVKTHKKQALDTRLSKYAPITVSISDQACWIFFLCERGAEKWLKPSSGPQGTQWASLSPGQIQSATVPFEGYHRAAALSAPE